MPPSSKQFDEGTVEFLGLVRDRAMSAPPKRKLKFDINQVPSLFIEIMTKTPGKNVFKVLIDDREVRDAFDAINLPPPGKKWDYHFWFPYHMREPGVHEVKIQTGYIEYKGDLWTAPSADDTFVPTQEKTFTIELTGVLAPE